MVTNSIVSEGRDQTDSFDYTVFLAVFINHRYSGRAFSCSFDLYFRVVKIFGQIRVILGIFIHCQSLLDLSCARLQLINITKISALYGTFQDSFFHSFCIS